MNERPDCRHFIACHDIVPVNGRKHYSLTECFQIIVPALGAEYPLQIEQVCLYTILSNGRGIHKFFVELVHGVGPDENVVYRSSPFVRDFGTNPVLVHSLPIRIQKVEFDIPGQYEFRLFCNDSAIASEFLEAKEKR